MSNEDKRRRKRFERAHCKRSLKGPMVTKPTLELVYRPKSSAEAQRRENRARRLVGTPFVSLPGYPDRKAVAFVATNGYPVKVEDVEMVFNDAALMDAISNWGEDGPLMMTRTATISTGRFIRSRRRPTLLLKFRLKSSARRRIDALTPVKTVKY